MFYKDRGVATGIKYNNYKTLLSQEMYPNFFNNITNFYNKTKYHM